ncbi:MAG: nitrilase [Desulfobacteraceae bacterium]|nr:nitrilase [Desulfobacteraceae bacterium]
MKDIRIAAVVCRAPVGELQSNLERTIHWTQQAKAAGAQLVCFPELNITGYCNHVDMAGIALPYPGPISRQISDLSQKSQLIILAGMAEHNPHGLPYASHLVCWPDGQTQIYRKLHLAPNERPFFSAGDTVPLFHLPQAVFGIQLCYDGHFPELSTIMTAKGAQIIFLPHASPRGDAQTKHQSWLRHLPARAYDNGIFVVACNQWGPNGRGLVFPGNAVAFDPAGNLLASRLEDNEGLLIVDLRAADWQNVRSHPMRHFFPNRRPELYA